MINKFNTLNGDRHVIKKHCARHPYVHVTVPGTMRRMQCLTPIHVRSTEVDMFGHVNNAKYLEYFEWGRFDWIAQSTLGERFRTTDMTYVVVNANIDYRHEARFGEQLTLTTQLSVRGRSSLKYKQVLRNASGVTVAEGQVTLVAFSLSARRAIAIPEELAQALDALVVTEAQDNAT